MKQGRNIVAITLIFLFIYIFIKLSGQQPFQPNNAVAYPGPSPEPTLSLAYPGPETQPPATLTPVATPFINWELLQPVSYLPVLQRDWKPLYFSIAGADQADDPMTEAIPENLFISPYRWAGPAVRNDGTYWYPNNEIQSIHTCLAQRVRYRHVVFERVIFKDTYGEWNDGSILCWDSMTEQFARIVRDNCQDPVPAGEMCAHLETQGVEQQLITLFQQHPSWIWLIANEPDNNLQDALYGSLYRLDAEGNPEIFFSPTHDNYATFYAQFYALANTVNVPRLVFCQSTWAFANGNRGLTYCANAFNALPEALIAAGVTNVTAPETIYALATHEYLQDCYFVDIPNQPSTRYCNSLLLTDGVIEYAVPQVWIAHLQEFEEWAQTTPGLENKPLWLTEFGSWKAWCPEVHPTNIVGVPGVPCTATGKDHVFYGRYPTEGIWGLQLLQVEYLARVDNNWQAVWWYVSRDEKDSEGLCAVTAWVWGANDDCELNRYDLSRAGETYRQAIECKVNHINCPPDYP